MSIQSTENMENKFEVGQKVFWSVGKLVCHGLFMRIVDADFSEVQCLRRNGSNYICRLKVISPLLFSDVN